MFRLMGGTNILGVKGGRDIFRRGAKIFALKVGNHFMLELVVVIILSKANILVSQANKLFIIRSSLFSSLSSFLGSSSSSKTF